MISVLSFNIHKGRCSLGLRQTLAGIRSILTRLKPDIVMMQEVRGEHDSITTSQFEALADTVWPNYTYGKNAVYDQGHHGNSILSRFPIAESQNINISTNSLENRGLLLATIDVPHWPVPLELACTHLDLLHHGRAKQLKAIVEQLSQLPSDRPLILGGDFNDWTLRFSRPLQAKLALKETFYHLDGAHVRTFPSFLPLLKLDRMYFRQLKPLAAQCPPKGHIPHLSDHLPILCQFDILPEAAANKASTSRPAPPSRSLETNL